ncbi:MAG: hypothetical protein M1297_01200 [Nitrospirae bacterium]|jgi:hypothetical protein|nr:hypothetical protein [Nitrospirota bacterium]
MRGTGFFLPSGGRPDFPFPPARRIGYNDSGYPDLPSPGRKEPAEKASPDDSSVRALIGRPFVKKSGRTV